MNSDKTILSLYDFSGNWSAPYKEAGYDVIQLDIKLGTDIRLFQYLPDKNVHGILAAPPCTNFAVAGAVHWKNKSDEQVAQSLALVDVVYRMVAIYNPMWYVIENPKGRLKNWIGKPIFKFQPYEYGDPYQKLTYLWGVFNTNLEKNVVEPEYKLVYGGGQVSQSKLPYADAKMKGEERRAFRSNTPPNFAKAFFKANP